MSHFGYIGHHLIVTIKKTIYQMESNGWVMWKMGTWLMTHDWIGHWKSQIKSLVHRLSLNISLVFARSLFAKPRFCTDSCHAHKTNNSLAKFPSNPKHPETNNLQVTHSYNDRRRNENTVWKTHLKDKSGWWFGTMDFYDFPFSWE